MALQLDVFVDYYPLILQGFMVTMAIAALAFVGGLAIGVIVALLRLSRIALASWIGAAYVEIFRNVPFLIEVFFLYYVLPFYGVRLPALTVGVIALAAYVGAYYAEIIRGAIQSIPAGQVEAARAVGMSRRAALRHIVVPQMFGVLLPPLTSQTLSMVKETAILSTITVKEGTMAALVVQGITFRPFEAFMMVGLLYWGFTAVLSVAAGRLELILQPYKQRAARRGMVALAPPLPVAIGR